MPSQSNRAYLRCPHCAKQIVLVPEIPRKQRSRIDWAAVDWGRPTGELVRELHSSRSTIAVYRRKYAPDTMGKALGAEHRHPWHEVDWTAERNRDIAVRFGVAPQTVAAKRILLAPDTVIPRAKGRENET